MRRALVFSAFLLIVLVRQRRQPHTLCDMYPSIRCRKKSDTVSATSRFPTFTTTSRPTRACIGRWTGSTTSSATRPRSSTKGRATRITARIPIADVDVHFGSPTLLLPARAALPLVRAAAADAVRAQRRRVLVRRQLRSGLLQRAPALRRDQRCLRAGRLHAAGRRRSGRAACVPRRDRRGRPGLRRARRRRRARRVGGRLRRAAAPAGRAGRRRVSAWAVARRAVPAPVCSTTTTDGTTAGTSTGAAAPRRRRTAGEARRRQQTRRWRGSPAARPHGLARRRRRSTAGGARKRLARRWPGAGAASQAPQPSRAGRR